MTVYRLDVDFAGFEAQFNRRTKLILQGIAQTVFNEIQSGGRYSPGTPIDTGFARLNWIGGIGAAFHPDAPSMSAAEAKRSPAAARQAARRQAQANDRTVRELQVGGTLVLANNAPYIRRLEYGWSKQAPTGMIRNALRNVQAITDEVVRHVQGMTHPVDPTSDS